MMMDFFWPSVGGILIGLSASFLLLFGGRIAGISGIVWGAMKPSKEDGGWQWLFLIGLLVGTWLYHALSGKSYPVLENNYVLAILGGLLVGIGVRLGNGCTSGHGVCGIGRMSLRSMTSTIIFMVVGIATVSVFRIFMVDGA